MQQSHGLLSIAKLLVWNVSVLSRSCDLTSCGHPCIWLSIHAFSRVFRPCSFCAAFSSLAFSNLAFSTVPPFPVWLFQSPRLMCHALQFSCNKRVFIELVKLASLRGRRGHKCQKSASSASVLQVQCASSCFNWADGLKLNLAQKYNVFEKNWTT